MEFMNTKYDLVQNDILYSSSTVVDTPLHICYLPQYTAFWPYTSVIQCHCCKYTMGYQVCDFMFRSDDRSNKQTLNSSRLSEDDTRVTKESSKQVDTSNDLPSINERLCMYLFLYFNTHLQPTF